MTEQTKLQADIPSLQTARRRILIVDDEEIIRSLAEKILARAGYSTIAVASGQAAIEATALWGAEIAVAVVDYSMSGMNGIDTMRELKKITTNLTFVVSSGHVLGPQDVPSDLKANIYFLQKPYRATQLTELVATIIPKPYS
jgi:two-component system, cell cycle sensor histidine kinase and response regulator CckA